MPSKSFVRSIAVAATLLAWPGLPASAEESARLSFSGEARIRYESLSGQFRAGGSGGDQAVFLRTLLHGRYDAGFATFGLELQDSRSYETDSGTPLSTSFVNPLDILQLYVETDAPAPIGEDWSAVLRTGRQTVSIGSKRQIERVSYANVIKSYTGLHYESRAVSGDEFHAIAVVPLSRQPGDRASIDDNRLSGDEEQWNRLIWGLHYRRANIIADQWPDLTGEIFVYGLEENDSDAFQTPDRHYVTPGFRLYRSPQPGRLDIDIEGAWRFGRRRASSAPSDVQNLDVSATMFLSYLGYTFDMPWEPRLALEYYWASGDDDPDDDRFDQYERLFGSRRTDLNNTSIHGPLTPANLSAPGIRLELNPGPRSDARLAWSAASLASARDSWVIARLQDPSGQSGDFIGHTLDGRMRYQLIPDQLELELGASVLFPGEFADTVPGSPAPDRTLFGYAQLGFTF